MTEVLGEVAKVLERLNDDTDSDESDAGSNKMAAPVTTDTVDERVITAVIEVAKKVEDNVRRVVTAAAAAPVSHTTPGSATIK